jgi:hypothetical protein
MHGLMHIWVLALQVWLLHTSFLGEVFRSGYYGRVLSEYVVASFLMLALTFLLYLFIPNKQYCYHAIRKSGYLAGRGVAAYFISVILVDREGREMVKLLFNRLVS